jgi:CrcB protein
MSKILTIAVSGALGALARYWLGMYIATRWPTIFPLGTFIINITGSFVIGFFLTFATVRYDLNPHWRLFIAVGFLGAYTTFSTFEYETLKLIEEGRLPTALFYGLSSVIVGLIAVWAGAAAAR